MSNLISCNHDEAYILGGTSMSMNVYKDKSGNLRVDLEDILKFLDSERKKHKNPVVKWYLNGVMKRFNESLEKIKNKKG